MPKRAIIMYAKVVNPKSAIVDVQSIENQAFLITFSYDFNIFSLALKVSLERYLYIVSHSNYR